MRQEELWDWRIQWNGKWTTTLNGATPEQIRKRHPEAIKILGSRCVRQVAETADDLKRLSGIDAAQWQIQMLKNCELCKDFGGWHPIQVGSKISYRIHGQCMRPGGPKTISQPEHGCAFWSRQQEAIESTAVMGDGANSIPW
jgi:hypothetical protein